jgi:hypothetical protein
MTPIFRPNNSLFAATIPWLLNLATRLTTRLLAHSLNMPEPLVHTTGMFMFAHVQAVETSIGRTLCPTRLWRALQDWLRELKARTVTPQTKSWIASQALLAVTIEFDH